MFRVPAFYPNLSLKLTNVLEDIGVNKRLVSTRKRSALLDETITTITTSRLTYNNVSIFNFGSQVEGTTTEGLNSDVDILYSSNSVNLIEDWRDWEFDRLNIMMIQDEHTPPGYCLLQILDCHEPLPVTEIRHEQFARYRGDMVVLMNSCFDSLNEGVKNGPADSFQSESILDTDTVPAIPCRVLPTQVNEWLDQHSLKRRISNGMKLYIKSNKCFVVPVGFKGSQYAIAEWRISTSHAERCIMFNLNITQIQCYVMMKLILKTYLKHPEETSVSSFMCKNVLLLCIEKTYQAEWCPRNLLTMLTFYLIQLRKCVEREYCPHFIIHQNNLMAGKFSPHVKHWLLDRLQTVIDSNSFVFLRVDIDGFGLRYNSKLTAFNRMDVGVQTPMEIARFISGIKTASSLHTVSSCVKHFLKDGISEAQIRSLITIYQQGGELERVASRLLAPFLCSTYGSIMASVSIYFSNTVSPEALSWLMAGLHSDVSSGKLKLASVFYSVGDFITVELILRLIQRQYDINMVQAICGCFHKVITMSQGFQDFADDNNSVAMQHIGAVCVRFLRSEIQCVPKELRFEMFRSTANDLNYRDSRRDFWMDWAVVDSLPYLYFLQYKTYCHLHRRYEQQLALSNLISFIMTTRNLGHTETAMNLLGQCMEQENRHMDPFTCYTISLNIRTRNNAANFHMCRLLDQFWRP